MSATLSPVILIHQAVGVFFLPPLCFIWLILLGLVLRRRALIWAGIALAYALSLPLVSVWLARPLEPPVARLADVAHVDAIVVLGGGRGFAPEFGDEELMPLSLVRIRYAALLARATDRPLLVSGGSPTGHEAEANVMARTLVRDYRIAPRWVEPASDTTEENASRSWAILHPAGVRRIALVSSAAHLRRATLLFRRAGFDVLPAPTGFVDMEDHWLLRLTPSGQALQQSWFALHEWLGLLWLDLHPGHGGS
jgi:uncharacterized SAM-binding protein YcdF (DUF218 family)